MILNSILSCSRHKKSLLGLVSLVVFGLMLLRPHPALAAPSTIPDPADFDQDVQLIVAGYGGGYTLDAPVSQVRIFTKSQTGSITITGAGHCDANDRGDVPTTYTLNLINSSEVGINRPIGSPQNSACNSATMTMNWSGLTGASTVPGHIGFYVIDFTARFTNPGPNGWNMFKLTTAGNNFISFYAGVNDRFAIKASGSGVPGTAGNYTLRFAPPCGKSFDPRAPLEYYDADAGEPNQNFETPVRTVLREFLNGSQTDSVVINITEGNEAPPASPMKSVIPANLPGGFTFKDGHTYSWTWEHIYSANGIQFRLPFDSINSQPEFTCKLPDTDIASCSFGLGAPPDGSTVSAGSTHNFNILASNDGTTTWTGAAYRLQGDLNGAPSTYPIASDPVRPTEVSHIPVSVTFGGPGNYTLTYQMRHSGNPFGSSCTRTYNVAAPAAVLSALCTGQVLNLNVGYGDTPVSMTVTNNGQIDWWGTSRGVQDFRFEFLGASNSWFVPMARPSPPFANLHHEVAYIGSLNSKARGGDWFTSDTFNEYSLKAGLGVGSYDFMFQMNHTQSLNRRNAGPIGPFGDVCHIIVTVSAPNPVGSMALSCTAISYRFDFSVDVGASPGGYPRLQINSGPFTNPLPLGGGGTVFTGAVDPFNGAAMGIQLYPHNSYTFALWWHNNSTGADLPMTPPDTLGPCLVPSCPFVNDSGMEPGEPQTLGAAGIQIDNQTNYAFDGNYNTRVGWSAGITMISPIVANPSNYPGSTPLRSDYRGIPPPIIISTTTSGDITSTFMFNGAPLLNCNIPIRAVTKPYFKSFYGDVSAGGGFFTSATSCPTNLSGIRAFARSHLQNEAIESRAGASTDFGAFVLGDLPGSDIPRYGFFSELPPIPLSGPGQPPTHDYNKLTFANHPTSIDPLWGIGLETTHCIADRFTNLTRTTAPGPLPAVLTGDGLWFVQSPVVTLGAMTVTGRPTLVVEGDVFINGNINTSAWRWTSTSNLLPLFTLVVKGNIYIANNVDRLDGQIIAQPTDSNPANTTGRIYTCANGPATPDADFIAHNCSRKLFVNGSFVAKQIKFFRTNGTLQNAIAKPAERPGAAPTNIAEEFNYTPEMVMSIPVVDNCLTIIPLPAACIGGNGPKNIDQYLNLPPIF